MNAAKARLSLGFAFAGANAYMAEKIESVKDVVRSLQDGYAAASNQARGLSTG